MDNKENILDELTNFEKRKPMEIPQILDEYLLKIAITGDTVFPWSKLKPLFMHKLERVISEFHEACPTDDLPPCPNVERFKFDAMRDKLLEAIDKFSSAPFTIQRLCELITAPRKHYKHTEKFMRGLEKNVLVVSTVEPGCSHIFACDCSRKRSEHQNTMLMNGTVEDPNTLNGVDNEGQVFEDSSANPSLPQPLVGEAESDFPEANLHGEEREQSAEAEMKDVEVNGCDGKNTCPTSEVGATISQTVPEEISDNVLATTSRDNKSKENKGTFNSDNTVSSSTHNSTPTSTITKSSEMSKSNVISEATNEVSSVPEKVIVTNVISVPDDMEVGNTVNVCEPSDEAREASCSQEDTVVKPEPDVGTKEDLGIDVNTSNSLSPETTKKASAKPEESLPVVKFNDHIDSSSCEDVGAGGNEGGSENKDIPMVASEAIQKSTAETEEQATSSDTAPIIASQPSEPSSEVNEKMTIAYQEPETTEQPSSSSSASEATTIHPMNEVSTNENSSTEDNVSVQNHEVSGKETLFLSAPEQPESSGLSRQSSLQSTVESSSEVSLSPSLTSLKTSQPPLVGCSFTPGPHLSSSSPDTISTSQSVSDSPGNKQNEEPSGSIETDENGRLKINTAEPMDID